LPEEKRVDSFGTKTIATSSANVASGIGADQLLTVHPFESRRRFKMEI